MAKIVAVTGCPTGIAHTIMAAEALKKTAGVMGHQLRVETQGAEGVRDALTIEEIDEADVVIVSSDIYIDMSRFAGKPMYAASTTEAIRYSKAVIEVALQEAQEIKVPPVAEHAPPKVEAAGEKKFIVAITSCPTGIAHTFMAAEGVKGGAESLGHEVKVETQGSVGAQNTLTDDDIQRADLVIIAAGDPFRVLPSIIVGSGVAAAISMVFGCELRVPHGGIFVLPIPNAVTNLGMYIVAIVVGTLVAAGMLYLLKRPLTVRTTTGAAAVPAGK